MKIGMVSDSLAGLTFEEVLDAAAGLGLDCIEFAMGAWSTAPHVDLDALVDSDRARRRFLSNVTDRGLEISALNCSGNPLHPGPSGREHAAVTRKTIELAALLGVERVVLMSGLPAAPGDRYPQWITCAWPAETGEILDYQWNEVVIPYWRELVAHAARHGIEKLCVEMHGHQVVYNAPTLLRLREAVGPTVGANLDPSHLMWMGADPIVTVGALGDAIYHVHAKDTRLEPDRQALTSRIETLPSSRSADRSWNYVTLGNGHGEEFWRTFCAALERAGYHDMLSIEHEDVELDPLEGVRLSVELLRRVTVTPSRW